MPHHRANRGMGGSKARNVPSNLLVVCASLNTQMESDAVVAQKAHQNGWKLHSWEKPDVVPYYDRVTGFWFRLDNDYGKISI